MNDSTEGSTATSTTTDVTMTTMPVTATTNASTDLLTTAATIVAALEENEISTGAIMGGIFVILIFTIIVLGGSQRLKPKSGEDGGTEDVDDDVDGDVSGIPGSVDGVGGASGGNGDVSGIPGGVDGGSIEECTTPPPTGTPSTTLPGSSRDSTFPTPSVTPQFCDSLDRGIVNRAFCPCEYSPYSGLIPCPSTQSHSYLSLRSVAHHDWRPQSSSSTIPKTTATSQRSDNGTTSSDAATQRNRTLSQGTNYGVRDPPGSVSSPTFSEGIVFANGVEPGSDWSVVSSTPVATGVPQLPVTNCVHCQRPPYVNLMNLHGGHVNGSESDASLSQQGQLVFQNLGCNSRRSSDETTYSPRKGGNFEQTIPIELVYSRTSSQPGQQRYSNYMSQPPLCFQVTKDHLSRVESQQVQPQVPRLYLPPGDQHPHSPRSSGDQHPHSPRSPGDQHPHSPRSPSDQHPQLPRSLGDQHSQAPRSGDQHPHSPRSPGNQQPQPPSSPGDQNPQPARSPNDQHPQLPQSTVDQCSQPPRSLGDQHPHSPRSFAQCQAPTASVYLRQPLPPSLPETHPQPPEFGENQSYSAEREVPPQSPRGCQANNHRPSGSPENQRSPTNASTMLPLNQFLLFVSQKLRLGHPTESVVPSSGHSTESKQSAEPQLLQGSMEMKELSGEVPLKGASASSESAGNLPTIPKGQGHCVSTCVNALGAAGLPAHSQFHQQGNQISEIPAHETQLHSITGSLAQEQDNGRVSASGIQPGSPGPTTEQPRLPVCNQTGSPRDQTGSPRVQTGSPGDQTGSPEDQTGSPIDQSLEDRSGSPGDEEIDALPEMQQSASALARNQLPETISSPFKSEENQSQLPATSQSGVRSEDQANDSAQQAVSVSRPIFPDHLDNYPAPQDHPYENSNAHVSIVSTNSEYSLDLRLHNLDAVLDSTSDA